MKRPKHFLGRFSPARLTVSPIYRMPHGYSSAPTPAEVQQQRRLRHWRKKTGQDLGDVSTPSRPGRRKYLDADMLPDIKQFLLAHDRLSKTSALKLFIEKRAGERRPLPGKSTDAIIARLLKQLRDFPS
jgi:hypothetical protein